MTLRAGRGAEPLRRRHRLRLRDGTDAMPLVRARTQDESCAGRIDSFGVLPYCWAHWVEFFPQMQRLEEPYAGRAQGLADELRPPHLRDG